MTESHTWLLPPTRYAVSAVRRLLRTQYRELPVPLLEDAELLVSELVTNAVLHGGGDVKVRVWGCPACVRAEVTDGGGAMPVVGERGLRAESGRGLQIVDALSTRWGATTTPAASGKTVWFELACSEPIAPPAIERQRNEASAGSARSGAAD